MLTHGVAIGSRHHWQSGLHPRHALGDSNTPPAPPKPSYSPAVKGSTACSRANHALSHQPLAVWREYNGRAACENVIKELDAGYGLPDLAVKDLWGTEAVLSLAVLAHNLIVLFERKLGWLEAVTISSLRYWIFVAAGVISHAQGQTTIRLAVPDKERRWWRRLWEKLLSPFSNCNAVENRPALP